MKAKKTTTATVPATVPVAPGAPIDDPPDLHRPSTQHDSRMADIFHDGDGMARRAFERLAPVFRTRIHLPTRPINRDVGTVVSRVLAYEPRIVSLRSQVVDVLPKHPLTPFDHLRDLALATWYCWSEARLGGPREARLKPLLDAAMPMRRKLANAARSAVDFGLLPEAEVVEIERHQGNRTQDLAHDLLAYPTLFFKHWDRLEGRTPVTRSILEEAQSNGLQLMAMVATDSDDPNARPHTDTTTPGDLLPVAWTALLDAWDTCRRAITYLRWNHGDLDQWCPPLRSQEVKGTAASQDDEKPDPSPSPSPTPA